MGDGERIESEFELLDERDSSARSVLAEGQHATGERRVKFTFWIDRTGETPMLEIEQEYVLAGEVVHVEVDSLAIENGTVPHLDESPAGFAESAFGHDPELLLGRIFDQAVGADEHEERGPE